MASSSSVLFRLICPKGITSSSSSSSSSSSNYCILGKRSVRSCAGLFYRRGVCTATTVVRNQDSKAPWLMLSPESEGGGTSRSYKFYSLAEKKLVQTTPTSSPSDDDVIRKLRLTCRGSSHGWLALLSPDNDSFFLYNPISRRHIKLPSILNLPTWHIHSSRRFVHKLILSCSPDEDEENCRAVLVRGSNPMAFCCPGRSKDWTLMFVREMVGEPRCYNDCVYSNSRRKLVFYGLTMNSIETWDLRDPSSPMLIKINDIKTLGYPYRYYDFSSLARHAVGTVQHLVVTDDHDLLFVIQYVMDYVGPDGSCFAHVDDESSPSNNCPHMTIGFDIYKYDTEKKRRSLKYVDSSSLGGLAIFLGMHSHSVAIPATDQFPELKPNSIYFTDLYYTGGVKGDDSDDDSDDDEPFNGHDIGIFSYEDKTVSPCYYPSM